MITITDIFKEIDNTLNELKLRAKELNPDSWHPTSSITYNPEGKKFITNVDNPYFYETTERDHNKAYKTFLFLTTDVYGRFCGAGTGSLKEKERILKTSETRKIFYKDDNVEVGLTIEHTLKDPTSTCWGYNWGRPDYYIIKNGKLTITERRSVIRKIFNGHNVEDETYLIKFDYPYLKSFTGELEEINELFKNVWLVEVEGKEYILSTDDDLWKWIYETFQEKEYYEWWKKRFDSIDNIIERLISGVAFDDNSYLHMNFKLEELLPYGIKEEPERAEVLYSNWDFDNEVSLQGLTVYEVE